MLINAICCRIPTKDWNQLDNKRVEKLVAVQNLYNSSNSSDIYSDYSDSDDSDQGNDSDMK